MSDNGLFSAEDNLNLIIKISQNRVISVICEAIEKDEEFVRNVTDFINSELSREAFNQGRIHKREWSRVDLSSGKILGLFCKLLRSDNELTKKFRKLIRGVMEEKGGRK